MSACHLYGVVLFVLSGCATVPRLPQAATTLAQEPLPIAHVGVQPKTLEVDRGSMATIRYELAHPATVSIDVVDEEGRVTRRLEAGRQSSGRHQVTWDGYATDSQLVSSGVYRYVIRAQDAEGQSVVYDPSIEMGGEELIPREFTFDHETRTFRWVMPKAGYARIRIGIEGFPHLRTLFDWQPLEGGEQTMEWNGLDASGLIHLADHPKLAITLHAFALPPNAIIVHNPHQAERGELRMTNDRSPSSSDNSRRQYLHARHPRAICHEPRLHIEFPDAPVYDHEGRAILSGRVPVRVVIDPDDAVHLVNSRFEIAIFEDLTVLFEEEDGSNPFTFMWDTSRLKPGPHLLIVNILGYDDHCGVATQPVMIEKNL